MHIRLLTTLLIACCLLPVCAATDDNSDDYAALERKAANFFDRKEWPNANAMYILMMDSRPDDPAPYYSSAVVNIMMGDTARAIQLIPAAMINSIPIDSIFNGVERTGFSIGRGDLFEQFLLKARESFPWYSRIIDRRLMAYYSFRDNGPEIVRYARIMLEGLPGDLRFMRMLARGQMLSGETDEAVATWRDIISRYPDDYDTLLDLANYFAAVDRPDEALPWFRRAEALRSTPYVTAYIRKYSPTPAKR